MAAPGEALAHYRLLEKIGEGGVGEVWRARDTKLGRDVAIKILHGAAGREPERLAALVDEAKAVAALNHPNIVTIYAVEETDDSCFIAMELVQGTSLRELIPAGGLPLETFFKITLPVGRAISAAHANGVVHRDLKPSNVMVSQDGQVKVLDFGLARFREPGEVTETTEVPTTTLEFDPQVEGTLPYMSPEQLQGRPVDHRSDIFSLGVIFYEMATGRRPFVGESQAELIASILRDAPPPLAEARRGLPRQLERILRHSLEKPSARRFQTALDLYNELRALSRELERQESAERPAHAAPDLTSIAVLPLTDLSGDPTQEFFADGMTDALIADLAKIGALKVISRASTMRFKGTRKSLREIARELNVGAVLEGSVLRAGDRVRIITELTNAATDELMWAERYERQLQDVLKLQGEVAQAVAHQVEAKLTTQERARLSRPRTVDPAAHEACLRGRYFWYKRTSDAVRKGLECFRQAIRVDPGYAPAWAGVADSNIVDGGRYLGVSPQHAYGEARSAAQKAVELDDGLAEAHTSLAAVLTDYDWDWEGAEREYRRAIELNPSYVTAHGWFAEHLSRMGRHDEAIAEAKRAQELDPLSLISNVIVAWILFFARRYSEAIEHALRTLELDADYVTAHRILGWAYEEQGKYEEAIAAHERASSLSGGSPNFRGQLGRAYALAGRRDEALRIVDELLELSRSTPISAFDIAIIFGALGEKDRAFEWLEKAYDERSDHMPYLKVNPRVDPLRGDPRFNAVLRRLGLVAADRA